MIHISHGFVAAVQQAVSNGGGPNALGYVGAVLGGGFFAFIGLLIKFKPERENLVVSSAQGGVTILNDVIITLKGEIERERFNHLREVEYLEAQIEDARRDCEQVRIDYEAYRERTRSFHENSGDIIQ